MAVCSEIMDSLKTFVSLLTLLTYLLISSVLCSHSPRLHSIHDYPIPILLQRRDTSAITTDCNLSPTLSLWFDPPGF